MVGGQYLDVAGQATTPDELRALHGLKTGRLIAASILCVLLLTGAEATADWSAFASELGVLFQIVDDILDVTGTDADLGKPHGSDERLGKHTYVSEYGLDGARTLARDCHATATAALERAAAGRDHADLRQIADFILTRTA
jgi:geranylgeranyl diphosphate synthase, type II